jgi:hypothetical protein
MPHGRDRREQVETGLDARHPAGAVVATKGEQVALR